MEYGDLFQDMTIISGVKLNLTVVKVPREISHFTACRQTSPPAPDRLLKKEVSALLSLFLCIRVSAANRRGENPALSGFWIPAFPDQGTEPTRSLLHLTRWKPAEDPSSFSVPPC